MSTETQSELQQLKDEIVQIKAELFTLQRNQQSRKGVMGDRGPAGKDGVGIPGASGRDGRDANLIIKTDHDTNTVNIFQDGQIVAKVVTVKGKDGIDGHSPSVSEILSHVSIPKDGRDGKDAPTLNEIVEAVLAEFSSRVKK